MAGRNRQPGHVQRADQQSEAAGALGLRERKRRQTREAIVDAGLRLFLERGYDGTTVDDVAAEAGISRRTFFAYFNSKEDVVLAAADTGFIEALRSAFRHQDPNERAFDAVCRELPTLVSRFENKKTIAIDGLLRSTPALRARKDAVFVQIEQNVFDALRQAWQAEDEIALRLIAMLSVGVLRVAMEKWRQDRGKPSLEAHVRNGFAILKAQTER